MSLANNSSLYTVSGFCVLTFEFPIGTNASGALTLHTIFLLYLEHFVVHWDTTSMDPLWTSVTLNAIFFAFDVTLSAWVIHLHWDRFSTGKPLARHGVNKQSNYRNIFVNSQTDGDRIVANVRRTVHTKRICGTSMRNSAPKLWNLLPNEIKTANSIYIFKRRMKKYFISSQLLSASL